MIDVDKAKAARARVEKNLDLFVTTAAEHGYPVIRPTVQYKNMGGRVAGQCGLTGISLNVLFLEQFEDEVVWHTLGHEFAHWIQFNYPKLFTFTRRKRIAHNENFYALCRILGVRDTRCHSMRLAGPSAPVRRKESTFPAQCGCDTYQITTTRRNKMLRGAQYYCRKCKTSLTLA